MYVLCGSEYFRSIYTPVKIEKRTPQEPFPIHSHDFNELVIVLHGVGIHELNGKASLICGGQVIFIRSDDEHSFVNTENLNLINVIYRPIEKFIFFKGVGTLIPNDKDQELASIRISQTMIVKILELITKLEVLEESSESHIIANREMIFFQIILMLYNEDGQKFGSQIGERFNLLLNWLDDNFSESIDWNNLSLLYSMSSRTINRQFQKITGLTPQRYLNKLRLTHAWSLLNQGEGSVTNIAFLSGFGDSNHFSTLFRREFGIPPSEILDKRKYLSHIPREDER